MSSSKEELISLIKKYNQGKASPEEIAFLEKYYQFFNKEAKISESFSTDETKQLSTKIFSRILQGINAAPVIPFYKHTWFRVAAASVLILLSISTYLLLNHTSETIVSKIDTNKSQNDIAAPAVTKATITLADGSKVTLDSLTSGTLATQGNVTLIKSADGQITYRSTSNDQLTTVRYNTLSNPRGSTVVNMTLADGSHVWLNAGSSVTYPIAFVGNERKVSITGEAYFEVTTATLKGGQTKVPFMVDANGILTEVLGTHFNVNSYGDEVNVKVTLLEGSVKVTKGNSSGLLKPGQQAILRQAQDDNEVKVVSGVDIDEVMAWKNGRFYFNGADIQTIMRQVARWYDVEVVYEGGIPTGHYNGKPSRDLTASEMLKVVEYSGVKVRIEGRKIIILK